MCDERQAQTITPMIFLIESTLKPAQLLSISNALVAMVTMYDKQMFQKMQIWVWFNINVSLDRHSS